VVGVGEDDFFMMIVTLTWVGWSVGNGALTHNEENFIVCYEERK